MKNAITVDLEDWYQGVGIPVSEWGNYEKRLRIGFDKIMRLFKKHNVKATFFILGKVIEDHPDVIQEIIDDGHEIGCHGYSHKELFLMNKDEFEKEIVYCKELIKPFGVEYVGFRAPYFSIDKRNLWAIDVLKAHNFQYDSSIFPGDSKRTGIPGFRRDIHKLQNDLTEVPISTFKVGTLDFALGGAYFRILPYKYVIRTIRKINKKRPAMLYIHPWEFDSEHPYLSFLSKRRRIPHYWNLDKTERKLDRLLGCGEYVPLIEIVKQNRNGKYWS
jgi:polysaccharide deacetylase family protein (PEP-CTERM system associated)